jgi:hypothetical protein
VTPGTDAGRGVCSACIASLIGVSLFGPLNALLYASVYTGTLSYVPGSASRTTAEARSALDGHAPSEDRGAKNEHRSLAASFARIRALTAEPAARKITYEGDLYRSKVETFLCSLGMEAVMRGEHSEIGAVAKIDHKSGMVSLRTEKSSLELHFEPGTIRGVNEGDTLNVQLGYTVKEHKPKGAAKGAHPG